MEIVIQNNRESELKHLNLLRTQISQNPNLDKFSEFFDDNFLKNFLRARKYDNKNAFAALENYLKVRTEKYPEFFRSMRPSTMTSMKSQMFCILKNPDQLNRAVAIDRIRQWDLGKFSGDECIKTIVLILEEAMSPYYTPKSQNGFVMIVDLDKYNLQHAKAITPALILKGFHVCYSVPLQYKAVHFVNEPTIFTVLFKAVSPFFPKKLRQRMHFHGKNLSSLHKHVPPFILPESLGGTLTEEDAFDYEFEDRILQKDDYYEKFAEML